LEIVEDDQSELVVLQGGRQHRDKNSSDFQLKHWPISGKCLSYKSSLPFGPQEDLSKACDRKSDNSRHPGILGNSFGYSKQNLPSKKLKKVSVAVGDPKATFSESALTQVE